MEVETEESECRERGGSPPVLNSWDLSEKLIAHQCPAEFTAMEERTSEAAENGMEEERASQGGD